MTERRGPVGVGRSGTLDEAFSLLTKRRRRFAWYHLADAGSVGVEALARRVADWEAAVAVAGRPATGQVAVSLRHADLPKLVAAGVVELDAEAETVRYVGDQHLDRWVRRARAAEMEGQ